MPVNPPDPAAVELLRGVFADPLVELTSAEAVLLVPGATLGAVLELYRSGYLVASRVAGYRVYRRA